ncbi:Proteasome subunit beta type-4 [Pichia californica]|uniref:Proteasome subunit beta n=1 Tax=Pichia californica TaxID=460514 RepID=A0A9P6WPC9_9ASCO|nr:Proteasome subunit beta type-4 [[Candida] californica]KAG0690641.1 Proteasome subunit beta type-4 [[Candida] californica]
MDIILGIRLKESTLFATSKAFTRGISVLKATDDKTIDLNTHNMMAYTGESGDTTQFAEHIKANVQLFGLREGYDMESSEIASFVRNQLATSLRSRKPYQVQVLIGGANNEGEGFLSMIDYLGTRCDLPYAAHGYAAFYTMSLLDHHYKDDISLDDGLRLLKLCEEELTKRMPMDFKGLNVKIVDKEGIRTIDF